MLQPGNKSDCMCHLVAITERYNLLDNKECASMYKANPCDCLSAARLVCAMSATGL